MLLFFRSLCRRLPVTISRSRAILQIGIINLLKSSEALADFQDMDTRITYWWRGFLCSTLGHFLFSISQPVLSHHLHPSIHPSFIQLGVLCRVPALSALSFSILLMQRQPQRRQGGGTSTGTGMLRRVSCICQVLGTICR